MTEKGELFTTRIRKATRKIHSVSDAYINAKFAVSLRNEEVWSEALFVFYHIFNCLEGAKERLNMPDMNKLFVDKVFYRKPAFEEDLAHYLGKNWKSTKKSQMLQNYIEHLQNLEKEQPKLLLAYVYHLYLGLLSGGQILAKKKKMFGEQKSPGNFYTDKVADFGDVDMKQLKQDFRSAMNEIAERMTKDEQDAFIEESNQVFLMNNLLVNSIGGQNKVLCNMLFMTSALLIAVLGVIFGYKIHN